MVDSLNIVSSKVVAGSRGTSEQLTKVSTNVATRYQELLTVSDFLIRAHHITCTCTCRPVSSVAVVGSRIVASGILCL